MFAPVENRWPSKVAYLREATELLISADLAVVEEDYASAGVLLEAAYQAFDDAAVHARLALTKIEVHLAVGAYATSY